MPDDQIPKAADNGGAWGFSTRDAGRIARTVKRVEAQVFNQPAERAKYLGPPSAMVPATLTGALASGSIAAPTSAGATRLHISGSGPGLTSSGGASITVYNTYAATVASGKTVWCVFAFGNWYMVQADC